MILLVVFVSCCLSHSGKFDTRTTSSILSQLCLYSMISTHPFPYLFVCLAITRNAVAIITEAVTHSANYALSSLEVLILCFMIAVSLSSSFGSKSNYI